MLIVIYSFLITTFLAHFLSLRRKLSLKLVAIGFATAYLGDYNWQCPVIATPPTQLDLARFGAGTCVWHTLVFINKKKTAPTNKRKSENCPNEG